MTLNQEPFVSADEAAKFLGIKRRFLLSLARRGIAERMRSAQAVSARFGYSGSQNSQMLSTRSGII